MKLTPKANIITEFIHYSATLHKGKTEVDTKYRNWKKKRGTSAFP